MEGRDFVRGDNRGDVCELGRCQGVLQKLSEQEQDTYRLPTEAEWVRVPAREVTCDSAGDDDSRLGEVAWYDKNAGNVGEDYAKWDG